MNAATPHDPGLDVDNRLAAVWRDSRLGPTVERLRQHVLRNGELTMEVAHYRLLHAMVDLGPSPMRELAMAVGASQSSVSRTVQRLESQGFVERTQNEVDLRSVLVSVTDEGRKVHDYLVDRAFDTYQEIFAVFTIHERDLLADLMERLLKSADATLNPGSEGR